MHEKMEKTDTNVQSKKLATQALLPRIFVNSFPKSGTHLALLLVAALAQPQTRADGEPRGEWFGTFRNNAWSDLWMPIKLAEAIIRGQPAGTWMKGHAGYRSEFEQAFNDMGTCMVFIYRDLRDVAVSLAYHIEGGKEQYAHAERELYMELPTHEDRILAVIEGFGKDPGLVARWELYAEWLNAESVLALRYEDVISNPESAAHQVLQYIIKRTAAYRNEMPVVIKAQYDRMVKQALYYIERPTEYSNTYRKGTAGEWKKEFTPRIACAFSAAGGDAWIERLNYEN